LNDRLLSVELVLDEIGMVTLPVQVVPVNSPPFGYSNLEPGVTPPEVQVQGRMKILEKLSRGQAYYNLEGAREDFATESPVALINADGEEVPADDLVILPAQVQIQVPVTEVISTREIPVHLMISGMLQTESLVRTVTIEPESVTATGPQEMLSALAQIDTVAMDVSDIMATSEFYIALAVPEGIQSVSADTVRVSVSVEPVMGTRDFEDVSVEIRNVPLGAYVGYTDGLIRTVAVKMGGTVDALSQLERNALRAFVDLTDLPPGVHTVGVTVQAPEGFSVDEITPAQVEVVLSRN
jgi:YbbR domain-containing protein